MPHSLQDDNAKEGSTPAGAVTQAIDMGIEPLSLMIGGYRTKKAAVLERRHELISLAQGWRDEKERLPKLVAIGIDAKKSLCGRLMVTSKGYENKRKRIKLKGIGAAVNETAEKLFYVRTENLIHKTFSNTMTWKEWSRARTRFAEQIAERCRSIFEELTQPYAAKPELIPVIAWARRRLNADLKKLMEEA